MTPCAIRAPDEELRPNEWLREARPVGSLRRAIERQYRGG
jgi:hypothetical protein